MKIRLCLLFSLLVIWFVRVEGVPTYSGSTMIVYADSDVGGNECNTCEGIPRPAYFNCNQLTGIWANGRRTFTDFVPVNNTVQTVTFTMLNPSQDDPCVNSPVVYKFNSLLMANYTDNTICGICSFCPLYQTPTRTLTTGQYVYGGLNEVDIDADPGMTFCIIAIRVTVTYQPNCNPSCDNSGDCIAVNTCNCTGTGYKGPTCNIPDCVPECQNNGTCVEPNVCDCSTTGYNGTICTIPFCSQGCLNNGVCSSPEVCDCTGTGYNGTSCEIPVCDPVCENGNCVAPNTCNCTSGWNGTLCEQPICEPGCQHNGKCFLPDQCNCTGTGYHGLYCDIPTCDGDCFGNTRGNCIAPNLCNCTSQWTGNLCQTAVCNPTCLHGNCSSPDVCDCTLTGYNGTRCELPICNNTCVNGFCDAPDHCECDSGYEGPICTIPICSPSCQQGNCIAPNVCDCNEGWNGTLCDSAICDPPCANGLCSSPDVCVCNEGWNGTLCNRAYCSNKCQHLGVCSAPEVCDCSGTGYQGPLCATPVCNPPCDKGTCVRPGFCVCNNGYNGTICNQAICDTPCQNGGICSAPNKCACSTRYEGSLCENRISDITDLFGSSPFGTAVDYALVGLSVLAAVVLIVLSVGIFLVMRARKNDISDPKEIEMRSEQPPKIDDMPPPPPPEL